MSPSEVEPLAADPKSHEAVRAEAEKLQADESHTTPRARKAKEHPDLWADALGKELHDDELDGVVGGLSPDGGR